MRRKPSSQGSGGYNNQARKPRYQGGNPNGGGDYRPQGGQSHNNNRPRKNYTAMREKYLAQARDALASGDRVLAENYFQHAEHCYRMMVEEGYNTRNNYTPPPAGSEQHADNSGNPQENSGHEEGNNDNSADQGNDHTHELPAFLTTGFEQPEKPAEPVIVQNWEE